MARDPRTLLWDVQQAADAILLFTHGKDLADYRSNQMLRAAVERKFEIIGEALNRLAKTAPDVSAQLPELPRIVAFRNLLIHGYASIDDATVWRTVQEDLPALLGRVAALLGGLGEGP